MKQRNRRKIQILKTKRSQLMNNINDLLDEHKHCEKLKCKECQRLTELGFLYEMYSARIRELKGISSDIDKIIHHRINNDILTLNWLAQTCELIEVENLMYRI